MLNPHVADPQSRIDAHGAAVSERIEAAFAAAEAGRTDDAVEAFLAARRLAVEGLDQIRLATAVKSAQLRFAAESEQFAGLFPAPQPAQHQVLVIADSLGLPRPTDEGAGENRPENTYSAMLQAALTARLGALAPAIRPWCQRFYTTSQIIDDWPARFADCRNADVIVHVGLNDYVNRIFLEPERIAVGMLPAAVRERVLAFAQRYRWQILSSYEDYAYVPFDRFLENLQTIIGLAQEAGARSVAFVTIITPVEKALSRSPHFRWNTARYNMALYHVAKVSGCPLIDLDRLLWEHGVEPALLPDLMHLSIEGHRRMANMLARHLETVVQAG